MMNEKRLEEWDVVLREALFAPYKILHSTMGFTTYFPMFRVEARVSSENILGLAESERMPAAYAFQ